jgi:hypothetical protein
MRTSTTTRKAAEKAKRSGVPLTVYLPEDQATQLGELSKERHVTKATIVRFAVDRLFVELSNGQLALPLGLREKQ